MTSIFAAWTLGSALLFSAVKNMSLIQLIKGEPGPGQPGSIVDATFAKSSGTESAKPEALEPFGANMAKGVANFGGTQVAAWMVPWLKKSRAKGWKGNVTSGYRSPKYSEELCLKMCGAPSCPGKCAGRSSNHSGKTYPGGAIDVSDYVTFARIQRQIGSPLRNALPADPVHFSVSGH